MTSKVFLATPTHDGRIEFQTASAIRNASLAHQVVQVYNRSSLLAYNCNQLYCMALNMRKHNTDLKWFAMLHSDIVPEKLWLDMLINIAEEHEADLLSAIVPIKDDSGHTSTATGTPGKPFDSVLRFDKKTLEHFTKTFKCYEHGVSELLVNTGCMVLRLDRPWSDQLHFEINDRIIKTPMGEYIAQVEPEDWNLSRQVHRHNGKVMATTAIQLKHIGGKDYWV